MSPSGEPASFIRRGSATPSTGLEPQSMVKKKNFTSKRRSQHHDRRPSSYWATLSTIWLTRGSLKEFDYRNVQEAGQLSHTSTPNDNLLNGRAHERLKRFARCGGPDLSHLRGVCLHLWRTSTMVC